MSRKPPREQSIFLITLTTPTPSTSSAEQSPKAPEELNLKRLAKKSKQLKVSPCGKFYFDELAALRVVAFFKKELRFVEGKRAGEPFELADWQERDLREIFGWKRFSDGTRRYRRYFLAIPRKNGKSTFCAGIAVYLLFAEPEAAPQIYSAAGDEEQARIIFKIAKAMINANPNLKNRCKPLGRSIEIPQILGTYRAISAQAFTKHGMSASGILFDELHVQKNRELYDTLDTSTGGRDQPLTIMITTAGSDKPSLCWEQWEHADKVVAGEAIDESLYVSIFAAKKGDDWKDKEVWKKANPNLGISPTYDYFERKVQEAINTPSFLNTFLRLHLNIWTEAYTAWVPSDTWNGNGINFNPEDLRGRLCYGAVDLSTRRDLTAFMLIFPDFPTPGRYFLLTKCFIPNDGIFERSRMDKVPYDMWRDQGHIIATPGPTVDYDMVFDEIVKADGLYNMPEVIFDMRSAKELVEKLLKYGINVGKFAQNRANYSDPTKDFEAKILSGRITHDKNPVLAWNIACTTVRYDDNANCRPVKEDILKSSKRIDLTVASIMALARATSEPPRKSPYNKDRGILTL